MDNFFYLFFYLDRRGDHRSRPRKRRTFIEFRGPSIERTDDGLFLFPQFRRFGVRGVSCWSSVTYFFLCVCVYIYIFFQEKEREREIERIFDDRDSEEFVLQHGQTFGKLKL